MTFEQYIIEYYKKRLDSYTGGFYLQVRKLPTNHYGEILRNIQGKYDIYPQFKDEKQQFICDLRGENHAVDLRDLFRSYTKRKGLDLIDSQKDRRFAAREWESITERNRELSV